VISLPLNVFYGAGVPACLLILRKHRPKERRGKVLLVYAARHYRELSAKNELRPQDVMRMLVHVQAYGDAALVPGLVEGHQRRLIAQIDDEERQEIERLNAFYEPFQQRLDKIDADIALQERKRDAARTKGEQGKIEKVIGKLESQRKGLSGKINERDEKIAEAERKAESDREQVVATGQELIDLYDDPDQLLKHARVVDAEEIEENEYNLNVPRYVDTFEAEPRLEVKDAIEALNRAEIDLRNAESELRRLLGEIGYAA
jgi:type I restriction enzyme M protein